MKKRLLYATGVLSAFLVLAPGCSTLGRSLSAGAGLGAGIGVGVGALADPGLDGENRARNVLIGGAIGGVVGAGAGYVADRLLKDGKNNAYRKGKKEAQQEIYEGASADSSRQPRLVPPRTEARWVPDQIRGNTFIPGHFEYVIIESAKWDVER